MAALKVTSSGSTSAAIITSVPAGKKDATWGVENHPRFRKFQSFRVLPIQNAQGPKHPSSCHESWIPGVKKPRLPVGTSKKSSAKRHRAAFSRALRTALKVMMLASTPSHSMVSRSWRACSHCWPFSQALMAALKLITLASACWWKPSILGGVPATVSYCFRGRQGGYQRQLLRSFDSQNYGFPMISATIFRVCPPQEPTSNTWTVSLFNIFHATKTHSDYRILLATLQPAVNLAPSAGRILRPFAIFPLSRKHWWPRCSWSRWTAENCEDAERSTAQQATSQPGSPGDVNGLPTQGMNGQWTSHHFWKKNGRLGVEKLLWILWENVLLSWDILACFNHGTAKTLGY